MSLGPANTVPRRVSGRTMTARSNSFMRPAVGQRPFRPLRGVDGEARLCALFNPPRPSRAARNRRGPAARPLSAPTEQTSSPVTTPSSRSSAASSTRSASSWRWPSRYPLIWTAEPGPSTHLGDRLLGSASPGCFGISALYHRPTWSPRVRPWLRRLDHAGVYLLIAGTYTPFGLLVLSRNWAIPVLAVVWSGAASRSC